MSNQSKQPQTVNRLVVLPFLKSVEISIKSIRVRFFRSMITTTSLILAIAFLCFINVSNDIADSLLAQKDPMLFQALVNAGYDPAPGDTQLDQNPKQRWIVMLSLLVCVVGIINAQLMAVTERFREIGTMKCLGALDRFILRLFLLEAIIQGFIGSVLGALAGTGLAVANGLLRFGDPFFTTLFWSNALLSMCWAVLVGSLLSLVGVFYPALLAARMQPVEAMRTEH